MILNYRTVMSFGQTNVDQINAKFTKLLEVPEKRKIRSLSLSGLAVGFMSCSRVMYMGAAYLLGLWISIGILGLGNYEVLLATFFLFYAFMAVG